MCAPASLIITRDRVFWSLKTDSHEPIITEYGLKDEVAGRITLVRVEITPPLGTDREPNFAAPLAQWQYRVDQDLLPEWYQKDPAKHEERARAALVDWYAVKVFLSGHHQVTDGNCFACGTATVRACGTATVRAYGSATVDACGSATVEARGSATVRAWGSATVQAWGSATVEACGTATVRAWDSATVRAWGNATVDACCSATVEARGSATVRAWDSATVRAWDSATVRAWDSTNCIIYGCKLCELHEQAAAIDRRTAKIKLLRGTPEV